MKTNSETLQRVQMVLAAAMASQQSNEDELLTLAEACTLSKVSRWTVARWLRLKDANGNYIIRWHKLGKSRTAPVRINRASFIAFLESHLQDAGDASINSKGEEVNHVQPNR